MKLSPKEWRDICNAAGSETDALDEDRHNGALQQIDASLGALYDGAFDDAECNHDARDGWRIREGRIATARAAIAKVMGGQL